MARVGGNSGQGVLLKGGYDSNVQGCWLSSAPGWEEDVGRLAAAGYWTGEKRAS